VQKPEKSYVKSMSVGLILESCKQTRTSTVGKEGVGGRGAGGRELGGRDEAQPWVSF